MNFSLASLSAMDGFLENDSQSNDDHDYSFENTYDLIFTAMIISIFICVVCTFGLLGNGMVIWLLGFKIKRTPFTTYVLNLAAADFGVSITLLATAVCHLLMSESSNEHLISLAAISALIFILLFLCMYSIGRFLLTSISIDRCVAVIFPIWHRCRRSPHLSTIVCVFIWVLPFLSCGIELTLYANGIWDTFPMQYQFLVNALLCFPLITISTLILFIKICFKPQQQRWGKLLMAILIALLLFLLFDFPLLALLFYLHFHMYFGITMSYLFKSNFHLGLYFAMLCASFNSSVHPLIYFLVGRKKRGQCEENMKVIFQRVFKEEEDGRAEMESPLETQL